MRDRSFVVVCVLGAALALHAQTVPAQNLTADEMVRRAVEARGGRQACEALESIEWRGSFSTFSKKNPFVLYRMRPDFYRFDFKYREEDVTYGWDGESSWWTNTAVFSQVTWAVEAPVVHARAIESEAEFGCPLLKFQEEGHQVELTGKADLDGEDTYQLVITLRNGSVETWHLGPESFLPVARISTGADSGMPVEQRAFFSDYREVAGVLFPYRTDIELGFRYQVMEVDEIRVNQPMADSLFVMPLAGDMGQLASLAGDWDVKVSSRPYPNTPWTEGEVASNIRPFFHGNLLEEELSYLAFGRWRHIKRQCSYDRFRDVFRIVVFDSLTSHLNILEGRLEDGRLAVTNLETGTVWTAKGQTYHTRELIYDIGPDHFKVDWEVSTDGGKTWIATAKFVYRRQTASDAISGESDASNELLKSRI